MDNLQAIILGLVQGLTEFLPVSSSGHLAICQKLMGVDESNILFFAATLHLGTLASVFVAYRSDIAALFIELFGAFKDLFTEKSFKINKNPTRRLGFMIVVSAIPTGLIGFIFNDFFETLYSKMAVVGISLIITGTILLLAEKFGTGRKGEYEMRVRDAFFIGLCQSVAIVPGISRSGSTLVGGLFSGLNRPLAVKFAFLMSIPPIAASGLLEMKDAVSIGLNGVSPLTVILGCLVAFFSGLFAIKWMVKIVTDKKLIGFSIYTWAAGAAVIVLSIIGIL